MGLNGLKYFKKKFYNRAYSIQAYRFIYEPIAK